ncbi:MAG TPA: hypothetical protein VFT64_02370 [Rickettsiales bacterium]|nr:hypothetical protein [Rickettsiales bacterium]
MQTLQTNRFICGEEDELSYADMCAIVEKDKELKSKLDQLNTYLETPGLPVEKKLDAVISTFGKLDDKPGVPLDEESRNLIGSEESSLLRIPDGITLEGKQAMRERCEKRAAIVSEKYLNGKPLRVIEVKK